MKRSRSIFISSLCAKSVSLSQFLPRNMKGDIMLNDVICLPNLILRPTSVHDDEISLLFFVTENHLKLWKPYSICKHAHIQIHLSGRTILLLKKHRHISNLFCVINRGMHYRNRGTRTFIVSGSPILYFYQTLPQNRNWRLSMACPYFCTHARHGLFLTAEQHTKIEAMKMRCYRKILRLS